MENTNDTETIIDSTKNNEEETTEEVVEEKKEVKPQETPEARLARLERQATQLRKKLGIEKSETKEVKIETKTDTKSDELDYGQKAFLRSYDIKGADEIALVKNWQKRTGDELDAIVEDDIFQAKLKSLREARATNDALPKSNRRGTQPAPNDESYWTARIESGQSTLADIEDVDMRRKVLNKRVAKEKSGGKFSSNPIVMT